MGVAIGNPLGPTLANFFLADLETDLFDRFDGIKPKGYVRYVDDIFCVFEDKSHITPFFDFLNSLHKNAFLNYIQAVLILELLLFI